jgi:protein TonB
MVSDGPSAGYRQPAQARAFGVGGLLLVGLAALVLLSIRLIQPPPVAIDAGQQASFEVQSIPFEQPAPTPSMPVASPEPVMTPQPTQPVPPRPMASVLPQRQPSQPLAYPAAPAVRAAPSAPPGPVAPAAAAPAAPAAAQPAPVAAAALSPSAAADWRARLLGHLERYRRYPRQAEGARQQGIARLAITLRRSGEVTAVELVRGSGYPLLDMEARATVRRASPLPPPDAAVPGDSVTVEVPIDFKLRR